MKVLLPGEVAIHYLFQICEMAILLILCLIYGCLSFNPSSYTNSQSLRPDYTLHWRLTADTIFLAFEVNTTGWVGFGIGEPTSGSMHGSDIVTGAVVNGVSSVQDRYNIFLLP